jgi:hypothetical protein
MICGAISINATKIPSTSSIQNSICGNQKKTYHASSVVSTLVESPTISAHPVEPPERGDAYQPMLKICCDSVGSRIAYAVEHLFAAAAKQHLVITQDADALRSAHSVISPVNLNPHISPSS